jgi:polyphosphate kinase 2 (PPK2 family)
MDAAGKDGATLLHDFLWRTTHDLPERRRIGIFNRSYSEEVLIARVHPEILRNEGLPDSLAFETAVWQDRYRSILALEAHLYPLSQRHPHREVLPAPLEGRAA